MQTLSPPPSQSYWGTALTALICGSLIMLFSLGIRHGFGLFLQPISTEHGWGRETYAFAMAIQNLVWGVSQPVVGMLADRLGAVRIAMLGGLLYAIGLAIMATVSNEWAFTLGAGVLIGLGLSGTTFPVIFGTISRLVIPERRSLAMGISMAVSSFGQFIMLPISLGLIGWLDWADSLLVIAAAALLMIPLALGLREAPAPATPQNLPDSSALQALREAFATRDFWLLTLGFYVCGFQVVFIGVHLPAYLQDQGMAAGVATTALALVGLFNVGGTLLTGYWGDRYRKPLLLSGIYLARAVIILLFILLPLTPASAYLFGIGMGLLWLSTVPPTNGTVAAVWGVKHMSMLGGIVFMSHQLGSFTGSWLGGWLYDHTGGYQAAWWVSIGLGVLAALLNWPVRETPMAQRRAVAT
ncbi:MAG: MFS transporter [Thiolinea sp.]